MARISHQRVEEALAAATSYSFRQQRADGYWLGEVYSSIVFTAEYVFFRYALGLDISKDAAAFRKFLLSKQSPDGSWGKGPGLPGDPSETTEAYLALKILGELPSSPPIIRARDAMIRMGGVEKVRMFTRVKLANFGLLPWAAVPQMPPEFLLLPSYCPLNIYSMASWARLTLIPLLIIRHWEPLYALPNGKHVNNDFLDEIWCNPKDKHLRYAPGFWDMAATGLTSCAFTLMDTAIYYLGGLKHGPIRRFARKKVMRWIEEHQEETGEWSGFYPPMDGSIRALILEGQSLESDRVRKGLEAIERMSFEDDSGKRIQVSVSPVWDTVLMIRGLSDAGLAGDTRVGSAVDWIAKRQTLEREGDWKVFAPAGKPGGWSFQFSNVWYPDVDDTAVAILALIKQDSQRRDSQAIERGLEWCLAMQSQNGGWGAYDRDNERLWLNEIPFSDMGALCDPATPDVTGRLLECFGFVLSVSNEKWPSHELQMRLKDAALRAIECLLREQDGRGPWWGRWGCNYVYGSSNVLCGLKYFTDGNEVVQNAVNRCVGWLRGVQSSDGGWGEGFDSYGDNKRAGIGKSTPSQTAWACMAMLSHISPEDPAIARGIQWLLDEQKVEGKLQGSWDDDFTATGFPGHLYLGYELYSHYFPLMALGRYRQANQDLSSGSESCAIVDGGTGGDMSGTDN